MIYFFIAFFASIIGSLSGLGGGVIIKPLLDAFSTLDVMMINYLSSFTIFSMSIISIYKRRKQTINRKLVFLLVFGSIIGTYIGDYLLSMSIELIKFDNIVKQLQNLLLLLILLLVLFYMNKFKHYHIPINKTFLILLMGTFLGILSALAGIGGGPLNMTALSLFFMLQTKEATHYSIILIFFSQLSKIAHFFFSDGFTSMSIPPFLIMIPSGIIGGYLGSLLYKKLTSHSIQVLFNLVLCFTLLTTLYNIFIA